MMAREIADKKMKIRPNCAARTHKNDIAPIRGNLAARRHSDRGLHFHRLFTHSLLCREWTLDKLLTLTEGKQSPSRVSENLPVMFVTEDTTRANPETIRALYHDGDSLRRAAAVLCVRHGLDTRPPTAPAKSVQVRSRHHR